MDHQLNWRKLQQVGLNAYESRSYLALVEHSRFKALELAAQAHVPRQKIYEVLDGLVEKGFAQVVQEKTKLFSAVDPSLAIPGYLARRSRILQNEVVEQARLAAGLIEDLRVAFRQGQAGQATPDFVNLLNDPAQGVIHYRRLLTTVTSRVVEFSRSPFVADLVDQQLLREASNRNVNIRILMEAPTLADGQERQLRASEGRNVQIRLTDRLPLKLALFDDRSGLVAMLDAAETTSSSTTVVFEHPGFAEAMGTLFESYWHRSRSLPALAS